VCVRFYHSFHVGTLKQKSQKKNKSRRKEALNFILKARGGVLCMKRGDFIETFDGDALSTALYTQYVPYRLLVQI